MANEAIIVELLGNAGDPISLTVADNAAITKGTLLKLTDPRTAAATSADNDMFIGVAAADKVANDGATRLAAYTHGIFSMLTTNAGITAGEQVTIGGANQIKIFTTLDGEKGYAVGKILETVVAAERADVLINIGAV